MPQQFFALHFIQISDDSVNDRRIQRFTSRACATKEQEQFHIGVISIQNEVLFEVMTFLRTIKK